MKNKKKNKSDQIVDESGTFLLEGRRPCLCEASRHELINNCITCGRIICQQEGVGPCFTCGTFILDKQQRNQILSGSDEAIQKIQQLTDSGARLDFMDQVANSLNKKRSLKEIAATLSNNPNLDKAIEHKNKLLEFDKKSVARSKVFDDQVDYFTIQSQNFITEQNRRAIANRVGYLVENKFNKVDIISIDLKNLTVSDYTESVIDNIDDEHRKLEELSTITTDYELKPSSYFIEDGGTTIVKKNLPPPIYVPSQDTIDDHGKNNGNNKNPKKNDSDHSNKSMILSKMVSMDQFELRIQDNEMAKIDDHGMCLAVRQPYASLLVNGIKRFEGRTWYSPFKGRLWIYAAHKMPSDEEIQNVEQFYRHLGHKNFPRNYPTDVMVGCVIIEDCLPEEVYRKQYPECEIESPYAFICDYPIAFARPLPVAKGGGRQIYRLEPKIHQACKGLLGF
ncbi:activating signal cointegrator 1-like protein [Euroglyphus maynei]|uniref:Activating signal cointegrator 1-like protein n=1 Tax=Euroglyphus maynei TaxID=6958 RepID=A0A1Y3AXE7_EURMA|nr:activating signal cointegrator 1-like protein [Euroglyphus maynei]